MPFCDSNNSDKPNYNENNKSRCKSKSKSRCKSKIRTKKHTSNPHSSSPQRVLNKFKQLFKKYYVEGLFHTHVSLINPKGKYYFDRQGLEEFWSLYSKLIRYKKKHKINLGIAEKSQHYLPVLADVDIKIQDSEELDPKPSSLYTKNQVQTVIEVYQSVLRTILDDCTEQHLTCVLLEKSMYILHNSQRDVTYYKHGFHLHFPYCFLSKIDQEVHLIPRVQEQLRKLNIFENMGYEDSGTVIDKSCCKVPWLVYGSQKSEDSDPYLFSTIYNSDGDEISLEKAFKNYQLYDHQEHLIKIDNVRKYLPRILSVVPYGRKTSEIRLGLISPLKEKIKEERKKKIQTYKQESTKDLLRTARILINMLSSFRVSDYNEWMTIGWALYNISEGSSEGLDVWCDFSARDEEKYDEATCIYKWKHMVKKDITIGTLKYYASIDSPEEYRKYKAELAEKYIDESLQGSHYDIAKMLHAEYSDEFVCASILNKIWFQFRNHKWERIEEGVFLRKKISSETVQKFIKLIKRLYDRISKLDNKSADQITLNAKIKQTHKMIYNLKSAPFKNNVMREAMELFYDPKFKEKLDTNPYLIGFKNSVYDLKLNIARAGRPDDYLSKNMPIDYIEYTEDAEEVQSVYDFLEKVFPDESVRKYFLDIESECFVGSNPRKLCHFFLGEGNNAKSITQSIFEQMMGKLAIKLNTTVITGKKPNSGAADPQLARSIGVRRVVIEEPNGDEQINIGTLKHLTGNDTFYARDLFEKGKDGREIKPQFKLILICNKLPKLKHNDKAVWNRIRVIPFESTFCREDEDVPESYEEQLKQKRFPMDKKFSEKIPNMLSAFAWVLLKHRQTVRICIEPEKVRVATELYRKQNDIYRQFMEECIMEDREQKVSLTDVYSQFKEWIRDSYPKYVIPIKLDLEEYLVKTWGSFDSGKIWKGYRIRTLQDNVDEGKVVFLQPSDMVIGENIEENTESAEEKSNAE